MIEWKVGEKAYVPVTITSCGRSDAYVCVHSDVFVRSSMLMIGDKLLRSIPPQPAPVDVSQIKVGDEVTVRGVVREIDKTALPFCVELSSGEQIWAMTNEVSSHNPSRPPSTLAEFDAMTSEQRERWFNEMKGKVAT